ncbi:MAG: hypothetical protein ACFB4I_07450 [Cyanophyceae cyanobacterium]
MRRIGLGRKIVGVGMVLCVIAWSLLSCSDRPPQLDSPGSGAGIAETAPPPAIEELKTKLAQYQPQVEIISPQTDDIFQDTTVEVQVQVQDYPLFQDEERQLGPHLSLLLDNQPEQEIYSVEQPIVLENLSPGTHTLRVFASRPWHESFKNEGAYAQTTFHVFTRTNDAPDSALPLLTYSQPEGTYRAEPILLDFYLTNAPLHLVAQEDADDEIADWKIQATVNGQSFLLEDWQPVYLKGWRPGTNWVQLELLDGQENPIQNVFNNTVRLIEYVPDGQDTLSKLMRGELSAQAARGIISPSISEEAITPPEPTEDEGPPAAGPVPELPETEEPLLEEPEEVEPPSAPLPEPSIEQGVPDSEPIESEASPPETPKAFEEPTELIEPQPQPIPNLDEPSAAPAAEQPQRRRKFFRRLRRPEITPSPSPEPLLPEVIAPNPEELKPGLIETQPEHYLPSEPPASEVPQPPSTVVEEEPSVDDAGT